jgi:MerR family mercuric resistance operon transcriptional regulator/MerR family gold-responsive transcriptional activator of gol and ges genes
MASEITIGRLARSVGVSVQTVRYYERRRLLTPTRRKPSGYRLYDDEALRRLRFIKNAQALGFTLREIAELLALRVTKTARCGDVQRQAERKLRQVEARIRDLQGLRRVLKRLIKTCRARQPTDRCPILQSLDQGARRNNERRSNDGSQATTR